MHKIYYNINGAFAGESPGITGIWCVSDYDNDGDVDIVYGEKIFKNLGTEFGNMNSTPNAPSTGFYSEYDSVTATLRLQWDYGSDTKTPEKGLYYNIRVATKPITDNIDKWIVSPSTGAGASPLMGNYPHGFCVASYTQPGLNLKPQIENTTYYWQVRSIDAGLRASAWSV